MKQRLYISSLIFLAMFACKTEGTKTSATQEISKTASEEEWIDLFNGNDLTNWDIKIANKELGDNYKNTFRVEDNMIRVAYDEYQSFDNSFGHLYFKKPFSYYKLKLNYRFTGQQAKGAASWANRNSGIMLHSQSAESNSLGQFFPVSIEFQFLGGLDDGERPTGNLCTPGTAVTLNDSISFQHCINSTSKTYNEDQWVSVEAIVLGDEKIVHIINNDTVMQYSKPIIGGGLINKGIEEEWRANGIEDYKQWLAKDGMALTEGYIALQAESTPIDFKNINLLNLCGCMDKKAKNYKSYYVKADNSTCIYD